MKIDWLHISDYGNLRNFEIEFGQGQPTTVLLGRNGSGKSYLFEAIVEIFRELENATGPQLRFRLGYTCHGNSIEIDADPDRPTKRLDIKVNGAAASLADFRRRGSELLPNYVFAYYSGWSNRLEKQFDAPTRAFYKDVLNSKETILPLRRLFYCRKEYSQLVLLAFFLSQGESAQRLLFEYLGIARFQSALFVFKRPWWRGGGAPNRLQLESGDERFWYARGAFKGFLSKLWDHAFAPIRNEERVERDIRNQGEKTERLYVFVKNQIELDALRGHDDTKTFFGHLESLFLCDLVDEVRVTVERTDGSRVKFTQLSEGEQQLLTVLGLMLFTQDDESLYLLDEPDTHLNPVWTYEYLALLQNTMRADKGQLIVATHNPLMVGSLHANQVRIVSQEADATLAREPEQDPIGVGIEGLLKSELYGLRSTLAPEILDKLDRHYQLLGTANRDEDQDRELMRLAAELNGMAVARTHPNPYFEHFANAMANRAPELDTSLSRNEIAEQARLADEVLADILSDEGSANAPRRPA